VAGVLASAMPASIDAEAVDIDLFAALRG